MDRWYPHFAAAIIRDLIVEERRARYYPLDETFSSCPVFYVSMTALKFRLTHKSKKGSVKRRKLHRLRIELLVPGATKTTSKRLHRLIAAEAFERLWKACQGYQEDTAAVAKAS